MCDTTTLLSSSTNLWASASKEWVIPAKPKPGRKPKKDVPPPTDSRHEADTDGKRVQNRAAQRAFRERKQSHLVDLQARLEAYERGDAERSVALQNVAKRLKEENEDLRKENIMLKEKLQQAMEAIDASACDKKRWRRDSTSSAFSVDGLEIPVRKKTKRTPTPEDSPFGIHQDSIHHAMNLVPLPFESSPDDSPNFSDIFNNLSFQTRNAVEFPRAMDTDSPQSETFSVFGCGFCSEHTPCVCREVEVAIASHVERTNSIPKVIDITPSSSVSSILDDLPQYQPPVPLRRRSPRPATTKESNSFLRSKPKLRQPTPANCSGNPADCMACANDSFGKAFCDEIGKVTAEPESGNLSSSTTVQITSQPLTTITYAPLISPAPETMPTNEAWAELKKHPNIAFSDLAMLAEVVSGKPKCTDLRVVLTPTPDQHPNSEASRQERQMIISTTGNGSLTNGSLGPELVPQDILVKAGRERVREVRTESVKEALRLLDAKFS